MKKDIRLRLLEIINNIRRYNNLTREICRKCGRESCLGFSVPDDMWQRTTNGRWNVLCLMCFDEICQEEWDDKIQFYPVSKKSFQEFSNE